MSSDMFSEEQRKTIYEHFELLDGLGNGWRYRELQQQLERELNRSLIEDIFKFVDQIEMEGEVSENGRRDLQDLRDVLGKTTFIEIRPGEQLVDAVLRAACGNRFRDLNLIQSGAIASGYVGIDTTSNQKIILKLPAAKDPAGSSVWSSIDLLKRASTSIQREEQILKQIYPVLSKTPGSAHPIAPVSGGVVQFSGHPAVQWTAQRFAVGQRLSDGMLPMAGKSEPTALTILSQVTTMVLQLFELRVAHGDLKPDALFWDSQQKQVQVIDWNSSRTNLSADDQQSEFEIVRRLVITLLGGLSEDRLTLRGLFFGPTPPDLSRGARLLLLRLSDSATHRPFKTVAEIDAALKQLESIWSATPVPPPRPDDQLNLLSVALQRGQETAELAESIRQNYADTSQVALTHLREWRNRDWRATYERLLLEPALLLPDSVPFGVFALFFHAWVDLQPRSSDPLLEPLVDAILRRGDVDELIPPLQAGRTDAASHLLQLLVETVRADKQLGAAAALVERNALQDVPQARQLLGGAQLLKSTPLYKVVSQRIDQAERTIRSLQLAMSELQALEKQPEKSTADQQRIYALLEQLVASGVATKSQLVEQHERLKQVDVYRGWLQPPQRLADLWRERNRIEPLAVDLAAEVAKTYYQMAIQRFETLFTAGSIDLQQVASIAKGFEELRRFRATPSAIRSQAERYAAELPGIVQTLKSLDEQPNLDERPSLDDTGQSPLYATLADTARRIKTLQQCAAEQTDHLDQVVAVLNEAVTPTHGSFAATFARYDEAIRKQAGALLVKTITTTMESSADDVAIGPAIDMLASLNAGEASRLNRMYADRQQERLRQDIDRASEQLFTLYEIVDGAVERAINRPADLGAVAISRPSGMRMGRQREQLRQDVDSLSEQISTLYQVMVEVREQIQSVRSRTQPQQPAPTPDPVGVEEVVPQPAPTPDLVGEVVPQPTPELDQVGTEEPRQPTPDPGSKPKIGDLMETFRRKLARIVPTGSQARFWYLLVACVVVAILAIVGLVFLFLTGMLF